MSARGAYWPAVIVALLVGSAGANIGFMVVANRDASFAVEPDYYRKAVEWDRAMAQQARNAELGWTVSARLEPAAAGRARLVTAVQDRAGAPLTGGAVEVEAFPSARAREITSFALESTSEAGVYAGPLPSARPGLWELRVRVSRHGEVFTRTISQDLAVTR
ncbi:MAG TPA: FixH family protein [Candidatus Deferrimicrobiaceae bacterium]|nr:FixH family protein [Candidatus Deferrimicrobiaceae bacterium]